MNDHKVLRRRRTVLLCPLMMQSASSRSLATSMELRRSSSRLRHFVRRKNCYSWDVMDADLLGLIAAQLDCGHALLKMPMVCRAWREAISMRSDALFEPLLYTMFPRAFALVALMPQAKPLDFKKLFMRQLRAESALHRTICPAPTVQLSDFMFSFELIRVPKAPFKIGDRIKFTQASGDIAFPDSPHSSIVHNEFAKHDEAVVDGLEMFGDQWWFRPRLPDNMFSFKWAPCAAARLKRRTSPASLHEREGSESRRVLQSWTGTLEGPVATVPLPWTEWTASWDEPIGAAPVVLQVCVSRLIDGELHTRRCFTSQARPGVDEEEDSEGTILFVDSESLDTRESFENDDSRLIPMLGFQIPHADADSTQPKVIRAVFEMSVPDSHFSDMSTQELLRYLEYCVPWRDA